MGAVPSRETHRRGLLTVNQGPGAGASSKKQDIVLIPLTREYFPSPDCPLFVQFHKARCDAAVNYYFRRPGDPGDLSSIPNYAGTTSRMSESHILRRRRRREAALKKKAKQEKQEGEKLAAGAAAVAAANTKCDDDGLDEIEVTSDEVGTGGGDGSANTAAPSQKEENHDGAAAAKKAHDQPASDADGDDDSIGGAEEEEEEEEDSYPSREALYRGVIDHVEEVLFDTDQEMREAYAYACTHPQATVGPNGQKLRKVLPVLCAVAFRTDAGKAAATHEAGSATASAEPLRDQQLVVESGVLLHGHVLNIVGCFGFVSMQEEVEAIMQLQQERHGRNSPRSPMLGGGLGPRGSSQGSSFRHDPYGYGNALPSSPPDAHGAAAPDAGDASLSTGINPVHSAGSGVGGGAPADLAKAASVDLITLPQPIAAPLAALVFLTKSAGEQNLGRVTHIAATTYYYQLIQAGVIHRRGAVLEMQGGGPGVGPLPPPPPPPPPPPQGYGYGYGYGGSPLPPRSPGSSQGYYGDSGGGSRRGVYNPATYPPQSPLTAMPELFQPPMETFSFSSLLTNIPILSFLYEMKCRWGYLGVLKGGTPTANSSFASSSVNSFPSFSLPGGRRPGTMMGNHSTGGLAAVDPYSGQGVTDEMEMWITPDHMIHGRISCDLASRLCLSLAERPEVMQERVMQLPSEAEGYWRYRGLVDRARPPPVPSPGKMVSIHAQDVYVMGSDVLPGFDEGDILRFDPQRLVWFADHSIPLEGVVLAAMRPYCKAAREADPTDPGWVTRLAPREELEYLQEVKGEGVFPVPAANAEQQAALAADANVRVMHEHEGNFYVYGFERDGVTYHHGTIPNFANPNKRRAGGGGGPPASTTGASATAAAVVSPVTPVTGGEETAAEVHTANTGPSAAKSTGAANTEKPTVQVPKTIASALFSLFPASSPAATTAPAYPAATPAAATTTAATGDNNTGDRKRQPSAGVPRGPAQPPSSTAAPPAAAAVEEDIPAYLRGRVTSTAIEAARKLVRNLYSYAYGAPVRTTAARPSPNGSRGVRTPHSATTATAGGAAAGVGAGGVQRTSYPPTTPLRNPSGAVGAGAAPYPGFTGEVAGMVAPPTAASLNQFRGAPSTKGGGGGMYPKSYRPPSSTARSSVASTPAARLISPNAPQYGGGSLSQCPAHHHHHPHPAHAQWPLSPGFSPEASVGPAFGHTTGAPQEVLRSPLSPGQPHSPPNVHVRVSSRTGSHHAHHAAAAEDGVSGGGGPMAGAVPHMGSYPEFGASPVGAPPLMQPTQQPVKRYKEDGNYVWDWRMGVADTSNTSELPPSQP